MRLYKCQNCAQVLYFENRVCARCEHQLGFIPEDMLLTALVDRNGTLSPFDRPDCAVRFCANAQFDACNWLVSSESESPYCIACQHNRIVPNANVLEDLRRWQKLELAKHRLFYSISAFRLPVTNRAVDPEKGLVFDFLNDEPTADAVGVMTGHNDGIITIELHEADDAERERRRTALGEPYRTLLGHFRHEVGHYFWDRLVRDGEYLDDFRNRFGDDRRDYMDALQMYYRNGPPADWQEHFISPYSAAHPWEDFAETWAHYFHMVDTLEVAHAFSLSVQPRVTDNDSLSADIQFNPYQVSDTNSLVSAWLPITFVVNSLNRAMGQPDLYPFVLSETVIEKLEFIGRIVHQRQARA